MKESLKTYLHWQNVVSGTSKSDPTFSWQMLWSWSDPQVRISSRQKHSLGLTSFPSLNTQESTSKMIKDIWPCHIISTERFTIELFASFTLYKSGFYQFITFHKTLPDNKHHIKPLSVHQNLYKWKERAKFTNSLLRSKHPQFQRKEAEVSWRESWPEDVSQTYFQADYTHKDAKMLEFLFLCPLVDSHASPPATGIPICLYGCVLPKGSGTKGLLGQMVSSPCSKRFA